MSDYSDIVSNYKNMSVSELGGSLLQRKGEIAEKQRKRDRKDMRIQQALGVLLAGQGLMKNAFKRRQKELANQQTLDLLTVDQDAKQIANLSTILNYKPTGYNSLEDFTKEINPVTGKVYTAKENTKRFFMNPDNKEGYTDKISPLIDQQIKFSSDPDMKISDKRRYDILQEVAAQSIFENMITDNNHVKYLNSLENMFSDENLTRDEVLQRSIGITNKKLESYMRNKYAAQEAEFKNQGLFGAVTGLFKGIGKDREKQGELNIFKNLKPEQMQDPQLREILDSMNLKSMVLESFDTGMKEARLSPDRYLNMVNNKKYEPLRNNMLDVVLYELKRDIDADIAFEKFGLQSFLDDGVMEDLFEDLTNKNSVAGVGYSKRAAALSLRFKNDPNFAVDFFRKANPSASKAMVQEFAGSISEDGFRNKFAALLVLEAGAYNPPGLNWSGSQFFGADTALSTVGLGDLREFDRNFQTKHGYNPAQAADQIDPLITPMFNVKTGVATKEYNRLSVEGKDNAWYKQAQQILNNANVSEAEKLEVLEKFNETTPNPLNLPVMEYLERKEKEKVSTVTPTSDNVLRSDQAIRVKEIDTQIQRAKTFIKQGGSSVMGSIIQGSQRQIDEAKDKITKLEKEKETLMSNPLGGPRILSRVEKLSKEIQDFELNKEQLKYNLTPSEFAGLERSIKEKTNQLDSLQNKEVEDKPSEPETIDTIDLDITKPKSVGEDVMKKAIEAVVDIQGVSDEYKQTTKNFLNYVAKAESNYGLNNKTFDNEADAYGPMQIIMSQSLAEIQRRLNPKLNEGKPIREYNELLKDNLNIDLMDITKKDLEQPVVSAAVARAYFMVAADAIPTEPEAMADYYVDNYVRYDPKSPTYIEDREKARQNFLVNNGFVRGGFTQTIKSLLDFN